MDIARIEKLRRRAATKRSMVVHSYQDCYKYAIPHREAMQAEGSTSSRIEPDEDVFDSTAIDSTAKWVGNVKAGMFPDEMEWIKYQPGSDIPAEQLDQASVLLDRVTTKYFELLHATNFDMALNMGLYDLAVGTMAILCQDYDENFPATFTAEPVMNLTIDDGPAGLVNKVWRHKTIVKEEISDFWPQARIPVQYSHAHKIGVLDAAVQNDNGDFEYVVYCPSSASSSQMFEIFRDELPYNPWSITRAGRASGEVWGRGPLVNALPDIRSANSAVEMILQSASLSIAGVYTAADDGVINPDTVEIAPGVVIPVGFNGGSNGRSLDRLPEAANFNIGELALGMLQKSIRRKLSDDSFDALDQSVRSAEEVRVRQRELAKALASGTGPMRFEFVRNLVNVTLFMWQRSGDLPKFQVDGKMVKIKHTSPLAMLQEQADMDDLLEASQRMNSIIPNLSAAIYKPEKIGPWISRKSGVPSELTNTADEIVQLQKDVATAAQSGTLDPKALTQ